MPVPGISPVSLMMPGMAETQVALSNIDRQRALAQALQQQSLEPIQGGASQGPLGPVTAPISWTQGLAKLLQGYSGGKMQGDLDARQLALIKGLSGQYSGMFGPQGNAAPVDQSTAVQDSLANGQGPTPQNAALLAQLRQAPQGTQTGGEFDPKAARIAMLNTMIPGYSQTWGQLNAPTDFQKIASAARSGDPEAIKQLAKLNYTAPIGGTRAGVPIRNPYDPTQIIAENPAVPENTQVTGRNPNGTIQGTQVIPGLPEAQDVLGTTPLEKVQNADQTFSYVPKRQLVGAAGASTAPTAPSPAPQPSQFDPQFAMAGAKYGVDPQDLKRLAITESSLNPQAVNKGDGNGGSFGLMQINGQHLQRLGMNARQIMDPQANIEAGAQLWKDALAQAGGDKVKAVQIYKGAMTPEGQQKVAGATNFITGGGLGNAPRFGQTQEQQIEQARQTAGGKALDEQFAKDYAAFVQGGAQDSARQLAQLQDVSKQLATPGANLTGPYIGKVPDALKSLTATGQNAIAMRERVEEVVQRSLRAILGAQFTENEGKRLIERAYNPNLPEAENAIRVSRLQAQLTQAFQAKQDAARYFEKNGTLSGWQGKLPTISDFDPTPQGATPGKIGGSQALEAALRKYGG